jgi:1-deoxy-D-xylulose-5-phosphate reductoisomerase
MKKIAILGSTGSIGTQALDIIEKYPDKFRAVALTCSSSTDKLREQIAKFSPEIAVTGREEDRDRLAEEFPDTEIMCGTDGLIAAACCDCDMVLNSLLGISGLVPTYRAIRAGRDIALANKETLVTGGQLIMSEAKKHGVKILPVDSEHSAIFQCLQGNTDSRISRILLTASGGPFRGYTAEQLEKVTLQQALRHPRWNMGSKITIDSATMMNKGFEVIEARWLFDVSPEQIQVLVHPQSIVHSMVEFEDTSVLAQLGLPDMRVPIGYAFSYPDRLEYDFLHLDLFEAGQLTFEKPDTEVFKCIGFAYDALNEGGSYPVVLNGANEVLVSLFLENRIKFTDIQNTLEEVLNHHNPEYNIDLEGILETDRAARNAVINILQG